MVEQPWRFRCPEGHTSVRLHVTTFWCQICGESYPKDDLVDLAPAEP